MSLLKKLRNKKLKKAVVSSVMALTLWGGVNSEVYAGVEMGGSADADAVAVGDMSNAEGYGVAIGEVAEAIGDSVSVGGVSTAEKASNAIGYKASSYNNSVSSGYSSYAKDNSVGIGYDAYAKDNSVAVGYESNAQAFTVSLGFQANGSGENTVNIGYKATSGGYSVGIGYAAEVADWSVGIGENVSTETGGVAVGTGSGTGEYGVAVGRGAFASQDSEALGWGASAKAIHSIAIGNWSVATAENAVALGSDSIATESYTVSFGDSNEDGFTRRLVNVSAGINDTDAANVSQLISSGSYNAETKQLSLHSNSGSNVLVDLSALPTGSTYTAGDGIIIDSDVISVKKDGTVTDGNTDVVTGGTVYDAIKDKADVTYIDAELANKADTDLGNITDDGKGVIGNIAEETLADDLNAKANVNASNVASYTTEWGAAIGTGVIEDGNGELVTGGTVYNAVKDKADITYVDNELLTKADVDLSNITEGGQTVIQNIAKGSIKLENGTNTTVSSTENADGSISYQVNVEGNGKAEAGNTGLINGDTLYNTINENITNVTEGINTELDGKANADASNVADHTAEWGEAIGTGKVEAGNGELVTGDTVYNAVKDKADTDLGNLTEEGKDVIGDIAQEALQDDLDGKANIDASNIETDKWADKLGTGTITAGDTNLVTGDTVYDAIKDLGSNSLVTSDGNTISVGKNDSATVIDISKHNGDGSTENRVITGIETDANDMSSAANVGYVNQSVGQLATDLNRGLSELDSRMKKGVAGAAALAALNPLDYDPENKLNFAAGVGSYKGESATALGMFYRPNENVMFSLGASIGNGENMWNAGITFNLDKPSASTSKAAMARAIKTMAAENDALEAKTAEQDAKIALLTEQVEALLATQEK